MASGKNIWQGLAWAMVSMLLALVVAWLLLDRGVASLAESNPRADHSVQISNLSIETRSGEKIGNKLVLAGNEEENVTRAEWYFVAAGAVVLIGLVLGGVVAACKILSSASSGRVAVTEVEESLTASANLDELESAADKKSAGAAPPPPAVEEPKEQLPPPPLSASAVEKAPPVVEKSFTVDMAPAPAGGEKTPVPPPLPAAENKVTVSEPKVEVAIIVPPADSELPAEKIAPADSEKIPAADSLVQKTPPVVATIDMTENLPVTGNVPLLPALPRRAVMNDWLFDENEFLTMANDMNIEQSKVELILTPRQNPAQLRQKNSSANPFARTIDPHLRLLLKKALLQLIDNHDMNLEQFVADGKLSVDSYKEYIEMFAHGLKETMETREGVSYLFEACGFDVKPEDINLHPNWRWQKKDEVVAEEASTTAI